MKVMIQNLFFFFTGVGSLSQPRLNIFTVGNMGVMICLGQGGLRSLSASSLLIFTSRPFLKTAGGIVLGSVAVSANVLPYISVAIKASFLKLGMCNICKNNIAKMFLDF